MAEYIFDLAAFDSNGFDDGIREEIVRCRDCTNYATDELGDYCTLLDFEDVKSMADGFCAWASRRKGAES